MATDTPIIEDDGHEPDALAVKPDVEQSFIDQLRARRTAIANETTKDFDVPGYEGLLKATYRRMGFDEVMKIARRVANTNKPREELNAQIDFLVRAVTSIDAADGRHIADGYTTELAAFFGLETQRARECVQHVFGHELAIAVHQAEVMRWMQSGESEVAEDFQGE